ncbi:MAG: DUF819 family protein [Actinomycetota bacterium]|nr:DUF819 family protein [Actinomycetota bacterium]
MLIVFYLLFPALVIYLCYRFPVINKVGAVIICYLVGMLVGNFFTFSPEIAKMQNTLTSAAVALALPLLLFSMDVKAWFHLAGKATLCMLLATIAILVVAFGGFMLIRGDTPYAWQLGGMAVGLYTGGTPNLAAIKTALDVSSNVYITMHTYDTVISLIYILFLVSVGQRFFQLYLPKFEKKSEVYAAEEQAEMEAIDSYKGILSRKTLVPLLGALGLSIVILAVAVGISELVPKEHSEAVSILAVTTLGIACSFIPKIRQIKKTFQSGMYLIYIFCLAVGSMANLKELFTKFNWPIMGFVIFCIFGSLLLHSLLCRIFKIDADTMIIVSTSAICSPPFVPVVANALKNPQIILSGLYTGIIGYAIGNYLGIAFSYLLKSSF